MFAADSHQCGLFCPWSFLPPLASIVLMKADRAPASSEQNTDVNLRKTRMTSWQRRKAKAVAAGAPAATSKHNSKTAEYKELVRLCTEAKAASHKARERSRMSHSMQTSESEDDANIIGAYKAAKEALRRWREMHENCADAGSDAETARSEAVSKRPLANTTSQAAARSAESAAAAERPRKRSRVESVAAVGVPAELRWKRRSLNGPRGGADQEVVMSASTLGVSPDERRLAKKVAKKAARQQANRSARERRLKAEAAKGRCAGKGSARGECRGKGFGRGGRGGARGEGGGGYGGRGKGRSAARGGGAERDARGASGSGHGAKRPRMSADDRSWSLEAPVKRSKKAPGTSLERDMFGRYL